MISIEELWMRIDREVPVLPSVSVPLGTSRGRRLAEDIRADADMPAFTRSAIDGFLLPENAPPGRHRIVGEVRPGMPSGPCPSPGEAVRIFTGSALPESGSGLVMVEDAVIDGDHVVTAVAAASRHVRARGSQARAGDVLLSSGGEITPGAVALLASVGVAEPRVSPLVRTAHLVTGAELTDVSAHPAPGFIRDSNSPLIAALLAENQAERIFHARTSEDIDQAVGLLEDFCGDLLLISGGASVGAYDGTGEILQRLGFSIHSAKVKSRPGKPLIFATRGAAVAFGLPGNPLSHFVCFHLFVRRAIARMTGLTPPGFVPLQIDGPRPPSDPRETWWPACVRAEDGRLLAVPLPWTDSSDLTGLPRANALLRIGTADAKGLVDALLFGKLVT
ncbi:MAG TPA: molybdopterin molybdotransferase MoeA [Terrimicrobiaceae bacterium]|nr:molybdopterin molybdotransferase MoeA [Terrimicrobiaceae bacterium]